MREVRQSLPVSFSLLGTQILPGGSGCTTYRIRTGSGEGSRGAAGVEAGAADARQSHLFLDVRSVPVCSVADLPGLYRALF